MKRENSEENEASPSNNNGGNKKSRLNDVVVRLLIPSRIAGAVIGKGGQHIQKMRSEYNATVSVDTCKGPERTIFISSEYESVISIIKEMLKYFEDKDNEVDVRMLIHQSLAGCIIGKAGTKIKEMRGTVGCRILKVFSRIAPQSTDRIVQIIGTQEQCIEGIREILNAVKGTPIKGSVQYYDPLNFDDEYADEYGGFGGEMENGSGGRGGGMRGNNRRSRSDRRDGNNGWRPGNSGGRDDRNRSGGRGDREYINPWANNGPAGNMNGSGNMGGIGFGGNMGNDFMRPPGFTAGFGGGSDNFGASGPGSGNFNSPNGGLANLIFGNGSGSGNFGGNGGNFGGNLGMGGGNLGNSGNGNMSGRNMSGGGNMDGMNNSGGGPGDNDNKNSNQVTIPKDLAGAIIGKGGQRIRRIRDESGAYITIDEPLPGSNDRIITIAGNPKQIQYAQYLLQQSVRENRRQF